MYTIPTLSRTAMHYAYNTDTTDTVPDGVLVDVTLFDTNRVLYRYDYLQRQSNKIIKEKPGQNESVEDQRTILEERFAYSTDTENNKTTNRVSTKRVFWNNALIHQFQHGYDALGNITNIYDAVTLKRVNYTYDDQGQLLNAVHKENGTVTRTETYSYDNVGNIKTFNNGTTSHTYTYGDTQWKDLLTKVDGNTITYDASGNPTEYYNNWTMTWAEGRRLESVTVGSNTYTYQYNADGQRVKKTNPDGSYIEYYVVNGVTVGESHFTSGGSKTRGIRYTFDENNTVVGITTGGENYYFAKNLQGDVLAVYQESNNAVVAQYTYDSWGNVVHATGSLAQINPFRYRGYYCDEETDFYYLQSRYYDPAIGRFLNPDQYSDTGDGVLGFNMFAYCLNNPVNRTDDGGCFSLPNWAKVAIGVAVIAAAAVVTVATAGAAAGPIVAAVHCAAQGALVGSITQGAIGAATGAISGAIEHRISTGSWEGAGQAALDGAADGFMQGTIEGAIEGAINSPYCFVAGTLVHTENGTVAIETVEEGDLVWAWDELSGDVSLKPVVETYINETDELIHVFVNGEEIVTTPSHPFYSPVRGWTDAVHLRAGDILVLVNGEYVVVEKVQHEILESPVAVYNFQVADYHTYYVADAGVLVHNKCSNHGNSLSTNKPAQGYILRNRDNYEILKYGETTMGYRRYTKAYLEDNNAFIDFVASGTKAEMHQWQHDMILNYVSVAGHRPPLNFNLY